MADIISDDQSSGNPRAASVRIAAHDAKGHSGQRRHDLRIGVQPGYVDADRTGLNRVLIEPPSPTVMRRIAEDRRSRQGAQRAMKSNAAISTAGIITFGSEAAQMFEALTPDQQDHAFRLLSRAVAMSLRTSVHGLVVHRDEATIHAHFVLCAYNRDGLPLSKSTRPAVLSGLQDLTAKVMQRFCPEIERGRRYGDRLEAGAKFSEVVHKSVRQLHRELPADIEAKRADLKALDEATAEARARVDEMQARVEKLTAKAELTAKEAKRLETYQKRLADRIEAQKAAEAASAAAQIEADRLAALARADHEREAEAANATAHALSIIASEIKEQTIKKTDDGRIYANRASEIKKAGPIIRDVIVNAANVVNEMKATKEAVEDNKNKIEHDKQVAAEEFLDISMKTEKKRNELNSITSEIKEARDYIIISKSAADKRLFEVNQAKKILETEIGFIKKITMKIVSFGRKIGIPESLLNGVEKLANVASERGETAIQKVNKLTDNGPSM